MSHYQPYPPQYQSFQGQRGGDRGGSNPRSGNMMPSKVVHVRNLPQGVTDQDLVQSFSQFGPVAYTMVLPSPGQGLVEFSDVHQAQDAMAHCSVQPIFVRGAPVAINFSKSNEINRNVAARNQNQQPSGPPSQYPPMHGSNYGGNVAAGAPSMPAMPPPSYNQPHGASSHTSGNAPGRVLLISIHKAIYPITVKVMEAIMSSFGRLVRMVIFQKERVQALVEFSDESEATAAKNALEGKDIYDGCCTLQLEYSRMTQLKVQSNTERSWDFTNPNLDTTPIPGKSPDEMADEEHLRVTGKPLPPHLRSNQTHFPSQQSAMMDAPPQFYEQPPPPHAQGMHPAGPPVDMYGAPHHNPAAMGMPPGAPPYYGAQGMPPPQQAQMPDMRYPPNNRNHRQQPPSYPQGPPQSQSVSGQRASVPVVIVYDAEFWRLGVREICNLACLYGNVNKVKKLSKGGSYLVEMQDNVQAQGVIDHLSGLPCFGQTLRFDVSKHPQVQPGQPVTRTTVTEIVPENEMPRDCTEEESQKGVPSGCRRITHTREVTIFGDYTQSPVNRFKRPDQFQNNIFKPSKTVHFGNAPPDLNEDQVYDAFVDNHLVPPKKIVIFPGSRGKRGSGKKLGLMEFPTLENAVEAISVMNNTEFRTAGGSGDGVYTVKLSFSQQEIKASGEFRRRSSSSKRSRSRSRSPSWEGRSSSKQPRQSPEDHVRGDSYNRRSTSEDRDRFSPPRDADNTGDDSRDEFGRVKVPRGQQEQPDTSDNSKVIPEEDGEAEEHTKADEGEEEEVPPPSQKEPEGPPGMDQEDDEQQQPDGVVTDA